MWIVKPVTVCSNVFVTYRAEVFGHKLRISTYSKALPTIIPAASRCAVSLHTIPRGNSHSENEA
jgi:hypothetical protein